MTEGWASARWLVAWRRLACAALAAALLGGLAAIALRSHATGPPPASGVRVAAGSRAALENLPAAAAASLSGAVGAKEPAYAVVRSGSGLRAQSPAAHLASSFGRDGALVQEGGLDLGLSLQAIGYGAALRAVGAVAPAASANRVTYAHAAADEWYVNGPLGVEQGFTLAHSPSRAGAGPLTLAIGLSGDSHATLAADGQSVTFANLSGTRLRYGGLSASDASGRALHSWLTLSGRRLLLHVAANGARFPLTIDPVVEQDPEAKLQAVLKAGEAGTSFGRSVALSADGKTALVGGPGGVSEAGAAWVFTRVGKQWTQDGQRLDVPAAEESIKCAEETEEPGELPEECGLGWSVALSGDGRTAILGAPLAAEQEGAAWVFDLTETNGEATWAAPQQLSPANPTPRGHFGRSVALSADGTTALIGAPASGSGKAFVFTDTGGAWSKTSVGMLVGNNEAGDSRFGRSVALSGDGQTALVGGPGDAGYLGAAWLFAHNGSSWNSAGKVTGTGATPGAHFGFAVALSADGDTGLVGAFENDGNHGGVWTFARSGEAWSEQGGVLAGSDEEELFGYSLALSPTASEALIGAPRANAGRGAGWLYGRSGASWTAERKLIGAAKESSHARFGASVAMSADIETFLVGGPHERSVEVEGEAGTEQHQQTAGGAAWVFGRGPTVEGISPATGPTGGGTAVTITGQHFTEVEAVRFGTTSVPFTVLSASEITIATPSGAPGEEDDITVETPNGVSATSANDVFTFKKNGSMGEQMPRVLSVEPGEGPAEGGTTVTITGENLREAKAVFFGATPATSFTQQPDGTIVAVSPAGKGTVDVTVEVGQILSTTSAADHFKYERVNTNAKESGTGGGETLGFTSSSGPLGSIAVAGCTVLLRSKTLAVAPHSHALLKLAGVGIGRCSGKVRLRVRRRLAHKRIGIKTIGTAVFTVLAGKHALVSIHLNATGRQMLAARHGRLNASVLIVRSTPAPTLARTASVRLRKQRPPVKKRTKK